MPVTTHVDRAQSRVRTERAAVDAKADAFEAFVERVEAVSPDPEPVPTSSAGVTATAGGLSRGTSSTENRCRTVRTAFAETVRPHSVADVDDPEPLLETVRQEFTDSIALALAPTTEASFTPECKQMLVSAAETRRTEMGALARALDREATQLAAAAETVETVTSWIVDADETPLTELGFDALRDRHETLATHRERCAELARDRQAFRGAATSQRADVGVRHRDLIAYLYQEFPVDHPVLTTVAQLDEACAECQRAVRRHLVRRA